MIITYGAFVSKTLDPQFISYYCKYIELYTLTYNLNDCLDMLVKNKSTRLHKIKNLVKC